MIKQPVAMKKQKTVQINPDHNRRAKLIIDTIMDTPPLRLPLECTRDNRKV